ncbi:MAG: polyprenyl synthetase family protein [Thermodesulfobacteriota bacterium]
MIDFRAELKTYQDRIDGALRAYFPTAAYLTPRVRKAMAYSLFAGGKRIRPILCLMGCRVVGGRIASALPAACALEYIHTYSLIHDDLPALDNDDFRRGRLTCHKKFGEATAILAGDALLTEAFVLLSRREVLKSVPSAARLQVIHIVAEAAGLRGMIGGQEADLEAEKKKVTKTFINFIHQRKTGAMIKASLLCGGVIGGGSKAQLRALAAFGEKIGLAFQIRDDLLNVEGQPRLMGKRTGTDEKKAKATYPLLVGLETSRAVGRELVNQGAAALGIFGNRAQPLIRLGTYVLSRDR